MQTLSAAANYLAGERGLLVHVDSARIFNPAIALGADVKALISVASSVTSWSSLRLAAPVRSVICRSKTFIAEVRGHRWNGASGGSTRRNAVNARALAATATELARVYVDHVSVQTNILYFRI